MEEIPSSPPDRPLLTGSGLQHTSNVARPVSTKDGSGSLFKRINLTSLWFVQRPIGQAGCQFDRASPATQDPGRSPIPPLNATPTSRAVTVTLLCFMQPPGPPAAALKSWEQSGSMFIRSAKVLLLMQSAHGRAHQLGVNIEGPGDV
jgi:hypothetical protein